MKPYKDYMDHISVSDSLHRRLVSRAADVGRTMSRPNGGRRYAAALACLAVVLLGALAAPRLLENRVTQAHGDNPDGSTSGPGTSASDPAQEYTLIFNRAGSGVFADSSYIPGHFWRELTADESQKVFPGLTDSHGITATANFGSDESGASLFNIDAHAVSTGGLETYLQVAPGDVVLDYVLDGDIKTSDVLGTPVTAGYFETKPNSRGEKNVIYFASFRLSGLGYYVELGGREAESAALREEFSSLIGLLIKGGGADLSAFEDQAVPQLRQDALDLHEAYADPDFGPYLPKTIPSGFAFQSAMRVLNQERDSLSVLWSGGMGDLHWRVSVLREDDKGRITSVADTGNYDLSRYPIPRADSVPRELREMVDSPIFRSEELTLEAVQARADKTTDAGDMSGPRMRFGVLYGDTLVEINVKGIPSETIFELLQQIQGSYGQ